LSNLVSNAVNHGDLAHPIRVIVASDDVDFTVRVENSGVAIPQATIEKLFLPFTRGKTTAPKPGLGLGLYIAQQIAIAHGGRLTVESDAARTSFIFSMPLIPTSPAKLNYASEIGSTSVSP
jgi:signal transduction histidine kinase